MDLNRHYVFDKCTLVVVHVRVTEDVSLMVSNF